MTVLTGFGDVYGEARGINNAGQVVGNSHYSHGAFLYSDGVMTDLGSLGGTPDYSDAYAVNNSTQVVGGVNYVGDSDFDRGVLWEDDTVTDLGDLPGGPDATRAYDINNLGQIVGESAVASETVGHAFLWQDGAMTDLGVLPGESDSYAFGINDRGVVVGTSYGTTPSRAFIWDSENGMRDLNSMLDSSGDGWILSGCRDINEAGQIVGSGYHHGKQHAFLLSPVPDSTPPLVECSAKPSTLWPPKHKMIPVVVSITATDDMTAAENLSLDAVFTSSNEPDDYVADGDTTGDVDGQDGFLAPVDVTDAFKFVEGVFVGTVKLRAECAEDGDGRVYTVDAFVSDQAGNIGTSTCEVVVKHDQGKKPKKK
jgi:probable HAF family extracellular repeat protein